MIYINLDDYNKSKEILENFAFLEPHAMAIPAVDIQPKSIFSDNDIIDILSANNIKYYTENFDFGVLNTLNEADGDPKTGGEEYKGIFIDRKTGNFKILSGRFPDKKAMIRKYGVLGKGYIVRKVFERSVFDWINENAENAIDAYLMFSTAFSKWKDIDILKKYYIKLIEELPQLFKNVRKSDVITQKQTNKTKNPTAQKTKSNNQESIQEADDLSAAEKHDYILNQATYDDLITNQGIDTNAASDASIHAISGVKPENDLKRFVVVKREYYDDLDNLIEVNNTPLKYSDKEENKYFNKELLSTLSDTFSFGQLKNVKKIGVYWENKTSRKRKRGLPNETAGAVVDQYDVKYYLASDFDALSYAIYDNLNIDENTQVTKLVDGIQYENMQEEPVIDIAGKKLEDSDCKMVPGRWFFYEDEKEMVPEVPELNKFYDQESLTNIPAYIMNAAFLGALRGSSLLFDYFKFQNKKPFTFGSFDGHKIDIKYEKNKKLLDTLNTYFLDYNLWNNGLNSKTTKEMYNIDPEFIVNQLKSSEKKDWNKDNYNLINEANKDICRRKFFEQYASKDIKNLYSHHFVSSEFEDLSKKCISIISLYKILYPKNNDEQSVLYNVDEPLNHISAKDDENTKLMKIKQDIIDEFIKNADKDIFAAADDISSALDKNFGANGDISKFFKREVNKQLIQLSKENIKKSQSEREAEIDQIAQIPGLCVEYVEDVLSQPLKSMKDIQSLIDNLHVDKFIRKYELDKKLGKDVLDSFINEDKIEELFTNVSTSIINEKENLFGSKNIKQAYQSLITNIIDDIKQQYDELQKSIFTQAFLSGKYKKPEDIKQNEILIQSLNSTIEHVKQGIFGQLDKEYYKNKTDTGLDDFDKSTLETISTLSKNKQFLSELNQLIEFIMFLSKTPMTTNGILFYFEGVDDKNQISELSQLELYDFYTGPLSDFYKEFVEKQKLSKPLEGAKINTKNTLLDARYSNDQYNSSLLWDGNICKAIDYSDEFINFLNSKDFSLDITEQNYKDKSYIIDLYIDNNINDCQKKLFDFSSEKYFEAHDPDQNEILKTYHFNPKVEDSYSSIDFLIKYIQEEKLVKDVFDFFLRNKMRFYDNFQPDVHGRETPAVYNIGQSISAKHFNVYKIGKEVPKYMVQEFQLRVPKKITDENSVLRYLNTNPGKTRKFVSYLLSAMNTKQDKKSIVVEFFPNNATRYSYTKELYNDPEYYTDKNTNFITTYYTTREKLEQSYNTQETTNNRNLMYHILFDIIKEEDTPNGFTYKIVPDDILLNKTHKTNKETGERYYQLTSGQIFLPLVDYVKQNVVNKGVLLKQRDNMTPEEQKQFDREIKLLSDQYNPTQPEYYSRMKANLSKNRENKKKYLQSIKIEDLKPFDDQTFEKVSTMLKKVDDGEVSLPSDVCTYLNLFLETKTDWKYWGASSDRKMSQFAKVRKSKHNPDYIDMEPQYDHVIHTANGQMAVKPDKDVEKPANSAHTIKKEPKNGKIGDFK